VARGKLAPAIPGRRWPRENRLPGEKPVQIGGKRRRAAISPIRIPFETRQADGFKVGWHGRREQMRRRWFRRLHQRRQFERGRTREGGSASEALIEHRAQRIDVARGRECRRAVAQAFRSNVMRRAEYAGNGGEIAARFEVSRESEIRQLGFIAVEQDIRWLDVPMQHPLGVRDRHGARDLFEQNRRLAWLE
jgi:hypothetical protein